MRETFPGLGDWLTSLSLSSQLRLGLIIEATSRGALSTNGSQTDPFCLLNEFLNPFISLELRSGHTSSRHHLLGIIELP